MAKTLTGIVTSDVANKTITVAVTSRETHPIYGKQYSVNRKYIVHDETNDAKIGDKVIISETRPISKTKSFKLDSIIEKSHVKIVLKDDELDVLAPKEAEVVIKKTASKKKKESLGA